MNISVVIPLYNKEKHIAHTIATVLAQTFADFELIVVDDGSTDRSTEIAESIRDERLTIVRKRNEGVEAARNLGVNQANGDYIAFIDADDEWMPHFLEEIASLITEYPNAAVFATALMVHERNGEEYRLDYPNLPNDGTHCLIENYFETSRYYSPLSSSSVCVQKRAFQKTGGFTVGITNGEDLDLWCRMALQYEFAYSSRPSAVYRRDSENMASRSMTTPSYFPFLTEYAKDDSHIIKDYESIERYILQRQYDAISASLFVIRDKSIARSIIGDIRFQRHNRKKYLAYKLLSLMPQSVIDSVYKIRSKSLTNYDA